MLNIFKKILRHKIWTGIIIIAIIAVGYYFWQKNKSANVPTRYVTSTAEKGTLTVSVSGTGQVSVSNQIDLKPKVAGTIIYVGTQNGQAVKTGALLAQIDSQEAQKSVRDAEINLESTKLSLEKLKQPPDQLSLLQAQNSLVQTKESKQNAEDTLKKSYDDGFNSVSNTFLDLPDIMTGLNTIINGYNLASPNQVNIDYFTDTPAKYDTRALQYRTETNTSYQNARAAFDKTFQNYKTASRFSDTATVESLISESYDTTKTIAEAIKEATDLLQFYKDILTQHSLRTNTLADTYLTGLNTYNSEVNGHLSSLLSIKSTIQNSKESIINYERSIAEKTISLSKLQAGADALDIRSLEMSIEQKESTLSDARQKLADYYIRAPFDGLIASMDAKKGSEASSGTALFTIVSPQQLAEMTLNEIDVAKIKVGQKANLTFDALPDLNISGQVADIDTVGTISQNVASYGLKIGLDVQDSRIKSGMSVSATIITEAKQNVILISSSAVKTQGGTSYVEIMPDNTTIPVRQTVATGLANDTMTEITDGLKEGDKVVTQTITGTTATTTQTNQNNNSLRLPGLGGGFGR